MDNILISVLFAKLFSSCSETPANSQSHCSLYAFYEFMKIMARQDKEGKAGMDKRRTRTEKD
jgi:hypothetical protein